MGENDIKPILGLGEEVTLVNGEPVMVSPLKFTQIPEGAAHINAVIMSAMKCGALDENGDLDLAKVGELFASCGEPLFNLICLCTDMDREQLDKLELEDGIELTSALVKVNSRPSLLKKLMAVSQELSSKMGAFGLTPSTDSSQQDTP